jgi:hypothetical protein
MQSLEQRRISYLASNTKGKHYQTFFCRFLHLKAQAPEVSDEQIITQAIKALRARQLHSYLV